MKARGLVPTDLASLDTALDALAAENHDSNGNGISDIDELKAGNDPNATGTGGSTVTPQYGCSGARSAPDSAGGTAALLMALLLGLAARRRRA